MKKTLFISTIFILVSFTSFSQWRALSKVAKSTSRVSKTVSRTSRVGRAESVLAKSKPIPKPKAIPQTKSIDSKLIQLQGKAGQKIVTTEQKLQNKTVGEQITVKTESGKRRVIDQVTIDKNKKIGLIETKSSINETKKYNNGSVQKQKDAEIAKSGATVVGKKGEAIGLPAGSKIPPTNVKVKTVDIGKSSKPMIGVN